VKGAVVSVQPRGIILDIGGFIAWLHVTEITKAPVDAVADVFTLGEEVTALVIATRQDRIDINVSTRALEQERGAMLNNRQAVYDGAQERAEQWRRAHNLKVRHAVCVWVQLRLQCNAAPTAA
jgi:small subunit ribosomal protein S1